MNILDESVPVPPSPERPPLAPYDPPDPAPQADAWRRAIRVVAREAPRRGAGIAKTRIGRSWTRRDDR
ncbi:MAG: hypothetical protein JWN43_1255 [Gammaproteobacteria bacterium]|nr:hypothetical protein [Gammaproteobacteria bacterium]